MRNSDAKKYLFKLLEKSVFQFDSSQKTKFQRIYSLFKLIQFACLVMAWQYVNSFKTYIDTQIEIPYIVSRWSFAFTRKSLEKVLRRLKEVLRTSPRKSIEKVLRRLKEVLRMSPGRHLENVSWKMSRGSLLEDVLRTSPGRHLDNVLKRGRRDFHFRPI